MTYDKRSASRETAPEPTPAAAQPRTLRLPGFLVTEDVGVGDVIGKATSWAGITPCGGCAKRAAALNQRLVFTAHRPR